jgi:hypothetical protein
LKTRGIAGHDPLETTVFEDRKLGNALFSATPARERVPLSKNAGGDRPAIGRAIGLDFLRTSACHLRDGPSTRDTVFTSAMQASAQPRPTQDEASPEDRALSLARRGQTQCLRHFPQALS